MSYLSAVGSAGFYRPQGRTEDLIARTTQDKEEQVRIATGSTSKSVLLNLAVNRRLEPEAAEALFDRNIDGVTKRLERLGYEQSFINKIF